MLLRPASAAAIRHALVRVHILRRNVAMFPNWMRLCFRMLHTYIPLHTLHTSH